MKFLVDMPLSPALARWLIGRGHDAVHASEVGLYRASDQEIVRIARVENRTIVTADLDYPRILALSGADEPSLILFRGGEWSDSDVVDRMDQILATASDLAHSMIVIDRQRIRRRKLPMVE